MSQIQISLPVLEPRYHGMPRRYEETKPVIIQDFSHRRILGIGHEVHRRSQALAEANQLNAIQKTEKEVWEKAEKDKALAVERALAEAKKDYEKQVKKLIKDHEKELKEEALRVEMMMQQRTLEQVQEERIKGERKLLEAVRQADEAAERRQICAVAAAREEERQEAKEKSLVVAKAHQGELSNQKVKLLEEKELALSALEEKLQTEAEKAVKTAGAEEIKTAVERLQKVKIFYDGKIEQARLVLEQKLSLIRNLEGAIKKLEREKENVEAKLLEVAKAFQDYIDHIKEFYPGQADFMLPPLYLEVIRSGKWRENRSC